MGTEAESTSQEDTRDRVPGEGGEPQQSKSDRVVKEDLSRMVDVCVQEELEEATPVHHQRRRSRQKNRLGTPFLGDVLLVVC